MPHGVLVQVQSRAPNKLFIVKDAARAVFIALIAILCRKDCELLWDIDILHNTAIIEAYSDTGNSNGEIPKKNPFFVIYSFSYIQFCFLRRDCLRNQRTSAWMDDIKKKWSDDSEPIV